MYIFIEYELSKNKACLRCVSETKVQINAFPELLEDIIKIDFDNYTEKFIGKYIYTLELNCFQEVNKDDFICDIKNKELYDKYCHLDYKETSLDIGKYENDAKVPFIIKFFYNGELICNIKNRKVLYKYLEV